MRRAEIARKFDEIVAFAETERFIDTAVKHYSSGMYMRLAFAVAAHLEAEILVVDEVLAVGDAAFQRKCMTQRGAHQEEGGRHPGLPEAGQGAPVVVLVSIVEGDRHCVRGWQPELPAMLEDLIQAHRLIAATPEPAKLGGESRFGHDVAACAFVGPADGVIHQDHRWMLQSRSGIAIGQLPPDSAPEGIANHEACPALSRRARQRDR